MFTSARNQLSGKVTAIQRGAVNDEIEITLPSGQIIVAVVTNSSAKSLGLEPGVDAFALVKASWIVLVTETAGVRLSARNQLSGLIEEITPGAVNTEVSLKLPDGHRIVTIITNESASALKLFVGQRASGVFKASNVIVGVKI